LTVRLLKCIVVADKDLLVAGVATTVARVVTICRSKLSRPTVLQKDHETWKYSKERQIIQEARQAPGGGSRVTKEPNSPLLQVGPSLPSCHDSFYPPSANICLQ